MKQSILSASGLCKSFAHNGNQLHILSGLNLELYQGEFTVVMGASGAGKSTLLYALGGMDRATAGQVLYKGEDLVTMREKKLAALRCGDFGFIFQQMHLVSNLSLYENVLVAGYVNRTIPGEQVRSRAKELMERMGIWSMGSHLPSQVSGGEQQRCAIARAVVHAPRLLFADEPTGALNRKHTTEVLDLLTELNQQGQSILMVTHDTRAAVRADRLIYLADGGIVGELQLPSYTTQEEKSRVNQVNAWLTSLEW